jgi:hypothetical protein
MNRPVIATWPATPASNVETELRPFGSRSGWKQDADLDLLHRRFPALPVPPPPQPPPTPLRPARDVYGRPLLRRNVPTRHPRQAGPVPGADEGYRSRRGGPPSAAFRPVVPRLRRRRWPGGRLRGVRKSSTTARPAVVAAACGSAATLTPPRSSRRRDALWSWRGGGARSGSARRRRPGGAGRVER